MIYDNGTFEEYQKMDGMNASRLKPYAHSPRDGWVAESKVWSQSKAMNVGTLVHAYVLEGEKAFNEAIKRDYITTGFPVNKTTGKPYAMTSGKFKEWFADQDQNKKIIQPEDLLEIQQIAHAVKNHKPSVELLTQCEKRETVITWDCPHTGMKCKAMLDGFGQYVALDLKTIGKELTVNGMERQIFDFGYHLQFAFYLDGLIANGYTDASFYVIFAQSSGTYDVGAFEICYTAIDEGRSAYIRAIRNYKQARQEKNKTGRFPKLDTIGIPFFAITESILDVVEP